jgi:nitrogen fixation/metabolism regulation signal transduction histidine kinase
MDTHLSLDGFDPLSEAVAVGATERALFEDATKRVVLNILRSYTGYYDVFSEVTQNALDAIDERRASARGAYSPRLVIEIDMSDRLLRVTDNGIGMTLEQFRYCFRPNVSFKKRLIAEFCG